MPPNIVLCDPSEKYNNGGSNSSTSSSIGGGGAADGDGGDNGRNSNTTTTTTTSTHPNSNAHSNFLTWVSNEQELRDIFVKLIHINEDLYIHPTTLKNGDIVLVIICSGTGSSYSSTSKSSSSSNSNSNSSSDFCVVINCNTVGENAGLVVKDILQECNDNNYNNNININNHDRRREVIVHNLYDLASIFGKIGGGLSLNDFHHCSFFDTQLAMELLLLSSSDKGSDDNINSNGNVNGNGKHIEKNNSKNYNTNKTKNNNIHVNDNSGTSASSFNLSELSKRLKTSNGLSDWDWALLLRESNCCCPPTLLKDVEMKHAINNAILLKEAKECLSNNKRMMMTKSNYQIVLTASRMRSKQTIRDIRFILDRDYVMCSYELAVCMYSEDVIHPCNKIEVHNEVDSVLEILPRPIKDELVKLGTESITDLSLDLKRRPHCWWKGQRKFLTLNRERNILQRLVDNNDKNDHHHHDNESRVESADLDDILCRVGEIGPDNRAGIEGALHRVSCIRNRKSDVIGVTIRFGRHISGNADMIRDLLCSTKKDSILFLGEPGSGKTTIVREATKILAEYENVFVVDTSNEIAGDGDLPHQCIGHARRLMVKSLKDQASVMIECVQNHTPSTMVIDEIGRPAEVLAARTSKHRGVRMIASAHGDLRSLLKNKDLVGLVGGIETITLGDKEAQAEAARKGFKEKNKQKTQRAGAPIFEVVVEVRRGMYHEWIVTTDSGKAVDDILNGEKYRIQRRIRDADTGRFHLKMDTL
mmetsp:Transcript_11692/g.17758  ORF Transcript_11692/g.17758 Transcript_11692/m.17758 type:complete len:759 (-) Transcript_11692:454-2730(-)